MNVFAPACLAVFALAPALTSVQDTARPKESVTGIQLTNQTVSQTLTDCRRAVMAELEKSANQRGQRLDSLNLIISSCREGSLVGGAPTSMGMVPKSSEERSVNPDPGQEERPGLPGQAPISAAPRSEDALGMVLLVGTFGGLGSEITAGSAQQTGGISAGSYLVRADPASGNAIQLVGMDDRAVATIRLDSGHHRFLPPGIEKKPVDDELEGRREDHPSAKVPPGKERKAGDEHLGGGDHLGGGAMDQLDRNDWPRIYMAIVHFLDPRLESGV